MLEPKFVTFWISNIRQAVKLSIPLFYICKIWDNNASLRAKSDKGQPHCCRKWHSSKEMKLHRSELKIRCQLVQVSTGDFVHTRRQIKLMLPSTK